MRQKRMRCASSTCIILSQFATDKELAAFLSKPGPYFTRIRYAHMTERDTVVTGDRTPQMVHATTEIQHELDQNNDNVRMETEPAHPVDFGAFGPGRDQHMHSNTQIEVEEFLRNRVSFMKTSQGWVFDETIGSRSNPREDFTDVRVPPGYAVTFTPQIIVIHFIVVLCINETSICTYKTCLQHGEQTIRELLMRHQPHTDRCTRTE